MFLFVTQNENLLMTFQCGWTSIQLFNRFFFWANFISVELLCVPLTCVFTNRLWNKKSTKISMGKLKSFKVHLFPTKRGNFFVEKMLETSISKRLEQWIKWGEHQFFVESSCPIIKFFRCKVFKREEITTFRINHQVWCCACSQFKRWILQFIGHLRLHCYTQVTQQNIFL